MTPKLETIKQLYELVSDKDFKSNMKAQQDAYQFIEQYFDNTYRWERFIKNIVHHPSFLVHIQGLIEFDKEDDTNEADLLINYILLNDSDKEIAFDLIKKLSDRNN